MQTRSSASSSTRESQILPTARSFAAAAKNRIRAGPPRGRSRLPPRPALAHRHRPRRLDQPLGRSRAVARYAPRAQRLAWSAWPTMQLSGSLALLASAVLMNYTQAAGRLAVVSALAGLVVAVVLTGLPEFDRLTAGASAMPWPKRLAALTSASPSPALSVSSPSPQACAICAVREAASSPCDNDRSSVPQATISGTPIGWRSMKRSASSMPVAPRRAESFSAKPIASTVMRLPTGASTLAIARPGVLAVAPRFSCSISPRTRATASSSQAPEDSRPSRSACPLS